MKRIIDLVSLPAAILLQTKSVIYRCYAPSRRFTPKTGLNYGDLRDDVRKVGYLLNRNSTQQDVRHDDAQGKDGDQGDPYEGFHLFAHGCSFQSTGCNGPITSIQAVILWF